MEDFNNLVITIERKESSKMCLILLLVIALLVILVCVIFPLSSGTIEQYLSKNGEVMPTSIAEKVFTDINGVKQGMIIKGEDTSKPVLLFLSGGPGITEYFLAKKYPTGIEADFVVCYWDYRGTALSYSADITEETMTTEQYISDAIAVTNYLRERFGQEKIYLIGHSFGTFIGVQVAAQAPQLYNAYIAMSQIADQVTSERLAYSYMLDQYRAAGNTSMVKKFEKYPVLESDEALQEYLNSSFRDTAMHSLGVGTMRNMDSVIKGIFFPTLRLVEFTQRERINIWRGKAFAKSTQVREDSFSFNAFKAVPTLKIPVYFFAGAYDNTCCYCLQKEYYEQLNAPVKAFYTFENSAHSPMFEEIGKALEILTEDVINGEITLADKGNLFLPD